MKPVVLMVGADKGGVGKTTVTRTVLDYLAAKNVLVRAFDAEHPRGTLQRFHPDITEVVDITTAADQMKMIDTLAEFEARYHGDKKSAKNFLNHGDSPWNRKLDSRDLAAYTSIASLILNLDETVTKQ